MSIVEVLAGAALKGVLGGFGGGKESGQPQQPKPSAAENFADLVRTGSALKSEVASLKPGENLQQQGEEDLRRILSVMNTEHFLEMQQQGRSAEEEISWLKSTLAPSKTQRPTASATRISRSLV